jgi:hypothetical protein
MLPVIKPKGGNWTAGSIDRSTNMLKTNSRLGQVDNYAPDDPNRIQVGALNDFVDKQLSRYIKNDMGTPEDPIRAMAEKGDIHFTPQGGAVGAHFNRKHQGRSTEPSATSPLARAWEDRSDSAIRGGSYRDQIPFDDYERQPEALRAMGGEFAVNNPDALAYNMDRGTSMDDLGFGHIIDELRNATSPNSGLPRELLLKPESLSKLSVPQAVERVAKINEWRASQISKARLENMLNADVHKEYPEKGMRWVQLNKPGQFAEESDAMGHSVRGYEPTEGGGSSGYGLGGWGAIESGDAKVYSLRDAKGQPHATIEVGMKKEHPRHNQIPDDVAEQLQAEGKRIGNQKADAAGHGEWSGERELEQRIAASELKDNWAYNNPITSNRITQIKGKRNAAPNEQYLPYVQDFVKSQQWSDVGDLQNTGLTRHKDKYFTEPELEELTNSIINPTKDWYNNSPYFKTYRQLNDNLDYKGNLYQDLHNWSGKMNIPAGTQRFSISDIHGVLSDPRAYDLSTVEDVRDAVNWLKTNQPEIPKHLLPENPPTMEGMKRGGPVNQDAMQMAVWNKAIRKQVGGNPTQAEIDAATRPARMNPNLAAQGEAYRANMAPPTSVMDPRYAAWKRAQDDAEAVGVVSDIALSALPLARPVLSGVRALAPAAKELGLTTDSMLMELMNRQGLMPGVISSADKALPMKLARAKPKTNAEIDDEATRVAKQMIGEHVTSGKPKDTKNLAGRSIKENERVKALDYVVDPTGAARESVIHQPRKGDVNIAVPGDQTVSDSILRSVGDIEGINSIQQGGSKYGLGKMHLKEPIFWASGEAPAQSVQNKVSRIADFYDPDRVIGQHLAMGSDSNNFAMHFADANLRAMDLSNMSAKQINDFDKIIAFGYKNPQTGAKIYFPEWPGIANPTKAIKVMKANPELRKWFNNRMKTPDITQPLGLPNGLDIQWAIAEPQLRNMEINLTGLSSGEMVPYANLTDTAAHNTYKKGIRGIATGHQEVLTPFRMAFPDSAQHIASTQRPQDFTGTIQKVFPHQIVDDQWIDEFGRYRDLIKKYTGKKKGGRVQKKAAGGMTSDDLVLEERKL